MVVIVITIIIINNVLICDANYPRNMCEGTVIELKT